MLPRLVHADANGAVRDHPDLLMLCARNGRLELPYEDELIPLPKESELFLLPGRKAVGFNGKTGKNEKLDSLAVAAFAAPGYTLSAHPAYAQTQNAPMLPLFAYGAAGYSRGRFWICAKQVDNDQRQRFNSVPGNRIEAGARMLLDNYPANRLVGHIINNCVRRYDCPAARNFALGRYEAPLPTARACNARCLGCISLQDQDSPVKTTPQCRLEFTPTAAEIAEVMHIHSRRERKRPVYSFGQGCEGDPLTNWQLLCDSIALFRSGGGPGTINCNSNASNPEAVRNLAKAGLTSLRVSLNSARQNLYHAYYRPQNYEFADVVESMRVGRAMGVHISLNLLYFPGVSDTMAEIAELGRLCSTCGVSLIQLRNLNIDPAWYLASIEPEKTPAIGLNQFMLQLKKLCPWLKFGYFNPWLGEKAAISAPMPG